VKRAPTKRVPARLPKLWRVKRAGKEIGAYHATVGGVRVNLGTQDAELALERRKAAVKGTRKFRSDVEGAADDIIAALETAPPNSGGGGAPVGEAADGPGSPVGAPANPAPPGGAPPPPQEVAAAAAPAGGDWHANLDAAVAAANVPSDRPLPPPVPEVSDDELAGLGVDFQAWTATQWAKQKVYRGFIRPPMPAEAKDPLAEQWKKIIAYAGVGAMLPPWVTGLLIPAVTLITATAALAAGFAVLAEEQRKAAGAAPVEQSPAAAPEGARAAA
jgi:hypothetical protein